MAPASWAPIIIQRPTPEFFKILYRRLLNTIRSTQRYTMLSKFLTKLCCKSPSAVERQHKTSGTPSPTGAISESSPHIQRGTASSSPLGTFSNLPAEIRCEIWKYFHFTYDSCDTTARRRPYSQNTKDRKPTRLDVLQTSRAINDEVSALLYDRELCICARVVEGLGTDTLSFGITIGGLRPFQSFSCCKPIFSRYERIRFEIEMQEEQFWGQITKAGLRNILFEVYSSLRLSSEIQSESQSSVSASLARLPEISIVLVSHQPTVLPGYQFTDRESMQRRRRLNSIMFLLHYFHENGLKERLYVQLPADLLYGASKEQAPVDRVLKYLETELNIRRYSMLQYYYDVGHGYDR